MKLTIDNIAQILNVPVSAIIAAMEELGLKSNENQLLREKEIKKLRPILFRYYQQSRANISENLSDFNTELCDSLLAIEPGVETISEEGSEGSSFKDSTTQATIEQSALVDSFLEQLILNYVIMIDTCSIMYEGCDALIEKMCPILKKHNKKVVIPYKVIEELMKHYNSWNDSYKAALAENGLKICQKLKDRNCITIRGNKNDNFADNVFFVHFADLRFKYNMLLITQDYKLSHDILQLNNMKTGGGNLVKVFRISSRGSLIETTV